MLARKRHESCGSVSTPDHAIVRFLVSRHAINLGAFGFADADRPEVALEPKTCFRAQ
jgi:hypothetical protein